MTQEMLTAELANRTDEEIAQAIASAPEGELAGSSELKVKICIINNHHLRWKRICEHALRLRPSRTQKASLLLEVVYATRCLPGAWDPEQVLDTLTALRQVYLPALEEGESKGFLWRLFWFVHGSVHEYLGDFVSAKRAYEQVSRLQGALPTEKAFAHVLAANAIVNLELLSKRAVAPETLQHFAEADVQLCKKVNMESFGGRFYYVRLLCLRQRIAWLTKTKLRHFAYRRRRDLEDIKHFAKEFGKEFSARMSVLQGAFLLEQGGHGFSFVADVASDKDVFITWRSEALLVIAAQCLKRKDREGTRDALQQILALEHTGHGGHVARAIARRILKGV